MIWKKWRFLLLFLPLLALSGFVLWGETPLGPMPEALPALQTGTQVEVETEPWLVFQPSMVQASTGLIFYPGGRVDPRAYAPAAHEIASRGYLVIIVPMPLNLAVLGIDRASDVIAEHPEIKHWAIGGHSLGGAMAASYTHDHTDLLNGLILWASYPASSDDLSRTPVQVLLIYGTQDGLSTRGQIDAQSSLLPAGTRYVEIEGGNHAQFGWYGPQPGDGPAAISLQDQQEKIVQATVDFLAQLGK